MSLGLRHLEHIVLEICALHTETQTVRSTQTVELFKSEDVNTRTSFFKVQALQTWDLFPLFPLFFDTPLIFWLVIVFMMIMTCTTGFSATAITADQ